MKTKVILTLLAIFYFVTVKAQQGYFPNASPFPYASDFITTQQPLPNIHWWNQKSLKNPLEDSIVKVKSDSFLLIQNRCIHREKQFKYSYERISDISGKLGKLRYEIEAPYGGYEPVGVGFGKGNYLDISKGNSIVGFKFKNTSDIDLELRVALMDSNKSIIDHLPRSAATSPYSFYTETIIFVVPPGNIIDTFINFNPRMYPAVPYFANYPLDSCRRSLQPTKDETFDYKKLSDVMFIVTNRRLNQFDGYKPFAFKGSFELSHFVVGIKILEVEAENPENSQMAVYPNPVSNGVLHLQSEALNIKVYDMLGNVVLAIPSGKEIDVSSFNRGMYTLRSSKGSSRFVVE